jgi:signal transduction histidine kinase
MNQKVFEWGVRLAIEASTFKDVYGKGIGLWEVKHIVEGHGGSVIVQSEHHSKASVTDDNIKQCITVFTVRMPLLPNTP